MLGGVSLMQFLKELYQEISDDDIFNGAAALGFYLTLAIFPAMIFVMAVIPFLPIPKVDQAIMDLLRQAMPANAAQMFSDVVQQVTGEQRSGLLSFGFLATLWATSTGMYAVMQGLNVTYDVKEGRGFIKARLTAIGLSILFVVLMVGGFSLIVLGGVIEDWLGQYFNLGQIGLWFFAALRWLIIVLGLTLALALIYYLAPDVKQEFRFITPGSILGVLTLIVASLGFAIYATNFGNYDATYGSIGAVIVLMLWLYIVGLVILLGSEINALVEHHAADGKQKGEKVEGQAARDPAARRRVQAVAPEHGGLEHKRGA
jgi:membrane protein